MWSHRVSHRSQQRCSPFGLAVISTTVTIAFPPSNSGSGTLTRSTGVTYRSSADEAAQMKVLIYKARNRSRTVLAAGGDSPVADSAGGDHSIFAEAILAVLGTNDRVLDGQALYNAIYDDVRRQSEKLGLPQDPRYDQIRGAGHRNGEFLFIPTA